ncbi:MAG: GNAT family N-acetyltransferase [Clostridia bacterium]|nr:GNAT family N-acetyltransferase [Clostridia bacterium]
MIAIEKARPENLGSIAAIYDEIHAEEEAGRAVIGWRRGVYPTYRTAALGVERGDMYILRENWVIRGAAVINRLQLPEYASGAWKYPAGEDGALVLHTLVISPAAAGRSLGRTFVAFYESLARDTGASALRMDTNARNLRARAFYRKLGYEEAGIVPTTFNGIPGVDLVLLEKRPPRD